jgi:molybdopterin synthase sulfur carrier subunit
MRPARVSEAVQVTVEFYGVPRLRAGRAELAVEAATLRDALAAVVTACPRLGDLVAAGGQVPGHYLLSLDGQRFVTDPDQPLTAGARLLVLSADAGG